MALREWRCYQCRRLIAKAELAPKSVVEIKCHCGAYNVVKVSTAVEIPLSAESAESFANAYLNPREPSETMQKYRRLYEEHVVRK